MNICELCRSIKLSSLRYASEDVRYPDFGQPFWTQIQEDWRHEVSGLVLRYDQNVLIDGILINHQNELLYYRQPFHSPTSVEHLGLDCKVEYTNANQGMMPEAHIIWVQYMQSEEKDLDNTFQGWNTSFPVLYFFDCIESDSPISATLALREGYIDLLYEMQEDSKIHIMSSRSRICSADSNNVQWSPWLGWVGWWVYPSCQTDE